MANTTTNNTAKVTKSDAELLKEKEVLIRKKYKRVQPGSIRRETHGSHAGKITVVITCANKGCSNTRRVATSDLFQVKYCEDCTALLRKKKRQKLAKAAKTEAAPAPKVKKTVKKTETKARKPRVVKTVSGDAFPPVPAVTSVETVTPELAGASS